MQKLLALGYDFYNNHLLQGQNEDINFYLNEIKSRNAKNVLIVGAGTGRIAIPLSNVSDVDALDIDSSRLDVLTEKKKDIKTYCMDICRQIPNKKYDLIIIPYSTIQLLLTKQKILKALKNCSKVLKQKGILIFDVSESFNAKQSEKKHFIFKDYSSEMNSMVSVFYKSKRYKKYIKIVNYYGIENKNKTISEVEKYMYYNQEKLSKIVNKVLGLDHIQNGYKENFFLHKHLYFCRKR